MSLKHLVSHADEPEIDFLPKQPTLFEQKRAAATTYEELVELGYDEGMEHPEVWATHVLFARGEE